MTQSLNVRRLGVGAPMVLLPWFSLDAGVMEAAFEPALAAVEGVHRIYVDLPGTGLSAPVAPSSDAVVDVVVRLLEAVGTPVLLVGCSYGGYLAAAVTRRRPDLVTALALVCSGVRIGVADRTLPDTPRRAPIPWAQGTPVEPWLRDHLEVALGTGDVGVAQRVAQLVTGATYDDAYLTDLREHGHQVSDEDDQTSYAGPVLMVSGRQDRIAGYVDQFAALERYPNGTYAVVDQAGHYLPFEQPRAFAGLLLPWVATALDRQRPPGE